MGRRPGSAVVLAPCTCGELVQGSTDGRPFLVSCPIDRYSRVAVTLGVWSAGCGARGADSACRGAGIASHPGDARHLRGWGNPAPAPGQYGVGAGLRPARTSPTMASHPAGNEKAEGAVWATLRFLGLSELDFRLEVSCPLPRSKGFGTSTADVVGAIAATAAAAGAWIDPRDVARLAVSVEPSDGTMFPGLALFDHRGATLAEPLGAAPPLLVGVLDFEGTVDTLDFNAHLDLDSLRGVEREHERALDMLRSGLRTGRLESIGRAATLSARANQRTLPKDSLDDVIALAESGGALGVCVAHSGTAVGTLFAPGDRASADRLLETARRQLDGLQSCWVSTMVDGGPRLLRGSCKASAVTYQARQGAPPSCHPS
jgi:L-threonine kinase